MEEYIDYYEILKIPVNSTKEQIKTAYKKAALKHHPDLNSNSTESNYNFLLIKKAYELLTADANKKIYDKFQEKHKAKRNDNLKRKDILVKENEANTLLKSQLNFIMWDIEDLFHKVNHISFNSVYLPSNLFHDVLLMCLFIDKWFLNTVDLFDTKNDLRNTTLNFIELAHKIHKRNNQLISFSYSSIETYFYNLRVRVNRFIEEVNTYDLTIRIENRGKSRLETWIDLQEYLVEYIESINESMEIDKTINKEIQSKVFLY